MSMGMQVKIDIPYGKLHIFKLKNERNLNACSLDFFES